MDEPYNDPDYYDPDSSEIVFEDMPEGAFDHMIEVEASRGIAELEDWLRTEEA